MRARVALAAAAALLVLALAGCGSSGGGDGGNSASQPPQEKTAQVAVETSAPGFNAATVFREASPGVVTIRSITETGGAEGSGFVLDSDGRIVTNAHVVTDDTSGERKEAEAVYVEFPDRNVVPAKIVGVDPFADVALLEVDPNGLELHPLQLGDDHDLVVGQPVAAIGSPFGEQQSLSVGIVSAINRSVRSLTEFQIEGAIQTDASINPGNSGGPLLDSNARVIGINQQIETNSGANDGVGFAVPISAVKRSISQLEDGGKAEYAYIGVSTQSLYPQLADRLNLDTDYGGLLAEVVPGGPADEAGLRGGDGRIRFQGLPYRTGGDVVLSIDGHKIVEPDDLANQIAGFEPGETVTLEVLHENGEKEKVEVTLGTRPEHDIAG